MRNLGGKAGRGLKAEPNRWRKAHGQTANGSRRKAPRADASIGPYRHYRKAKRQGYGRGTYGPGPSTVGRGGRCLPIGRKPTPTGGPGVFRLLVGVDRIRNGRTFLGSSFGDERGTPPAGFRKNQTAICKLQLRKNQVRSDRDASGQAATRPRGPMRASAPTGVTAKQSAKAMAEAPTAPARLRWAGAAGVCQTATNMTPTGGPGVLRTPGRRAPHSKRRDLSWFFFRSRKKNAPAAERQKIRPAPHTSTANDTISNG